MKTLILTNQVTGEYFQKEILDITDGMELSISISEVFNHFKLQTPEFTEQNNFDLETVGLLSTKNMYLEDYEGKRIDVEYILSLD